MARRPPFFWIVVAAGLALLASYPVVVHILVAHSGPRVSRGWASEVDARGAMVVTSVAPSGPAHGRVMVGDRIVAVDGDSRVVPDVTGYFLFRGPGEPYVLRVERGGTVMDLPLVTGERPTSWPWWLQAQFVVLSVGYLVAGLLLGLLRAEERTVRFFAGVCFLAAAGFLSTPVLFGSVPAYRLSFGETLTWKLLAITHPLLVALIYRGYVDFPPGIRRWRAASALVPVFLAWGVVLMIANAYGDVLDLQRGKSWITFATLHPTLWHVQDVVQRTTFPLMAFATTGILIVIARNYRAVRDLEQRRRIQWFLWGSAIGSLPLGVLFAYLTTLALRGLPLLVGEGPARVFATANLLSLAAPVALVYSLLKHDILDIRLAVRRGVQHLLATSLLRLIVFGPLVVLALGVVANPNRTVREIVLGQPLFVVLAAAGALGLHYRQALSAWVDRRFFRGTYDAEQLLLGLVAELRGVDSLTEVARVGTAHVAAALHPSGVQIVWKEDAGERSSSSGDSATGTVVDVLPLMRLLEGSGEARDLTEEDIGRSGVRAGAVVPSLAVPIGGGDRRLTGVLLLGPRLSDTPYSSSDRRLLSAIATQLAIVRENTELKRQASVDARARQEVLAHLDASGMNLLKECPSCGRCFDRDTNACPDDGVALQLTLPVDRTVAGKYRLERLLGRGGMGAVYEATDVRLDRRVAVKVMTGASFGNQAALRRFEREARACARLEHPNVITVFDYGTLGADGAYLVMERLVGVTLRSLLQGRAELDVAALFDEMLEGVAAAHAAGIVHRDLKPENVFVAADGKGGRVVKVLDFGLAKLAHGDGSEPSGLTAAGTVMGTLAYMSPEQLKGQPVDERTDVFAIGVMAAEAVTGLNPFRRADPTHTIAAILGQTFQLEGEGPEVRALANALDRCLAKDQGGRFASIPEMRASLVPALRACPIAKGTAASSGEDPTMERPAGA